MPAALGILVCAALVCLGALAVGQAVLRLCGARVWSWLAPALGACAMMLIAVPAPQVPGRALTTAAALAVVTVAAIAYLVATGAWRPPLAGLLAGLPVACLALLPFVASGRVGTLGVSLNNDMASHLLWAEAIRSEGVAALNPVPPSYPLGPHAIAASLAEGLGVDVDIAFAGLSVALPVLLGWTALAALRNPRPWGPFVAAPLVGMPFLIAAYHAQGSFKEVLQATIVVAAAILLAWPPPMRPRLRWLPFALLVGGALSVYSHAGLLWPLALLAVWAAVEVLLRLRRDRSPAAVAAVARRHAVAAAVALGALVVALVPQLPRLLRFASAAGGGTGIDEGDLGNLVGPLPLREAFAIWHSADYRFAPPDELAAGMWTALVVALVVAGAAWSLRRGEWMLPAAAGMALLVHQVVARTQSPYVAAKALVILTPLLMLLVVRLLAERDAARLRMPRWWGAAAPALAVVVAYQALGSSWDALAWSPVGSRAQVRELQSLRPLLDGRPTLFLGNDDFIPWMLADVPVEAPVIFQYYVRMPLRPEKPWEYGRTYDIDSLDVDTLNRFDWVVAPRDAASSEPPAALVRVRRTPSFDVFRRARPIAPREILAEGESAAAPLDCSTPEGRSVLRGGGVARVRAAPVVVPVPPVPPGEGVAVQLPLGPGSWDLVSPYVGPRPLEVTAPGLRRRLPANLARPGPRWPIGRIRVRDAAPVPVTVRATTERLTSAGALTHPLSLVAVPVGASATVPVASACGRLVDWYRPAREAAVPAAAVSGGGRSP